MGAPQSGAGCPLDGDEILKRNDEDLFPNSISYFVLLMELKVTNPLKERSHALRAGN